MVDKNVLNMLQKKYPAGTRICCDISQETGTVKAGCQGTVLGIDNNTGQIMMYWDNGSFRSLTPGKDGFHTLLSEQETKLSAEKRLHTKLLNAATDIALRAAEGETSFNIDELLEEKDFRRELIDTLNEMVRTFPGIENTAVHDIGIPFQNTLDVSTAVPDEVQSENQDEIEQQDMSM